MEERDLVYNLGGLAYGAAVVAALAAQVEEDLPLVNHFQAMLGPYAQKEGLAEEMEEINSADQKVLAEAAVLNIFLSHSDLEKSLASGFELSGAVNCVVPAAVHETDIAAVEFDASFLNDAARPDGQRPLVILTAGRFSDYAKGGDLAYRAFSCLAAERDDVFFSFRSPIPIGFGKCSRKCPRSGTGSSRRWSAPPSCGVWLRPTWSSSRRATRPSD